MADDVKPPEGGDNKPEGDVAKLTAEIETLKAALSGKDDELKKLESIRSELEQTRQAAKERERKALEEQGQYKTISENQAKELEDSKAKIQALESDLKAKSDTLTGIVETQRKELLAQIPEGDERKKWESADLDTLRNVAPLYAQETIGTFTGGAGHSGASSGNKAWKDMSPAERDTYTEAHLNDPATLNAKIAGKI